MSDRLDIGSIPGVEGGFRKIEGVEVFQALAINRLAIAMEDIAHSVCEIEVALDRLANAYDGVLDVNVNN